MGKTYKDRANYSRWDDDAELSPEADALRDVFQRKPDAGLRRNNPRKTAARMKDVERRQARRKANRYEME